MSASTPESTAAPTSSNLRVQAIAITAQKRQLSEDGESSVRRKDKKRKRDTNSVNLGSNSSVVAAASASHPLPPVTNHHSNYTNSPSHRKEKEKKKKRKKRRKMSIVTTSEFEDDQAKHTHTVNGSVPPASTISVTSQQSTMLGRTKPDKKDLSDVESVVAFRNNLEKKKGKEKALSPSPSLASGQNPPMSRGRSPLVDGAAQAQIDGLKQQLEVQSQLLKRHQAHLAGIQQTLTCQICLDLLYKPFALAPCGHVACYGCLVRWFTSPGPGENAPDNQNVNQNGDVAHGVAGNHIYKRKTCPICRALVFERPVEVWGMKDMVNALVRSKLVDVIPSASAEEASTSTDPTPRVTQASGSRGRSSADPWHKIFRSARNAYGNHGRGNPWWHDWVGDPEGAPDRVEGALEEVGMYDAEDHIHRCLDCMHEIWGGRCSHCDRAYPGHPEADDEEDTSDSDEVMDLEEEDYSEDEIEEYGLTLGEILDRIHGRQDRDQPVWGPEEEEEEEEFFTDEEGADWDDPVYGGMVWHRADDEGPGFAHVEEIHDEEQGEDEDGYESSFIDDGEGRDVIDVTGTSDEEDAGNVQEAARQMGRTVRVGGPRARRGVRRVVTSEDEGEGGGQGRRRR